MNVIISRIKRRINKENKNCLILIVGGTGSGKSLSGIKIARAINKDFDLQKHLVFTANQFMKLLNSKILKRGDVVLWDEAGVEFGSRDFYTVLNRSVSFILQTFRHKNLAVIFTVPASSFVDVSLRRLFHIYMETQTINHRKKVCTLKVMNVQTNPQTNKTYYKYPVARVNGAIMKITRMNVHLIDNKTIEEYEKLKVKFTKKLNLRLGKTIGEVEARKEKMPVNINSVVKNVKKNMKYYSKKRGKRVTINYYLVMSKFKCSELQAKQIKYLVEKEVNK